MLKLIKDSPYRIAAPKEEDLYLRAESAKAMVIARKKELEGRGKDPDQIKEATARASSIWKKVVEPRIIERINEGYNTTICKLDIYDINAQIKFAEMLGYEASLYEDGNTWLFVKWY